MAATDDLLFTRKEAAIFFKVSERTVWQWQRRYGLVPISRVVPYRYRFADLVAADKAARATGLGRPRDSWKLNDQPKTE